MKIYYSKFRLNVLKSVFISPKCNFKTFRL